MTLKSEYKASLKTTEAEEILDLAIFRPLSFLFVKLIYNTSITPNHISIVAMAFGIAAGIFYGMADYKFLVLGSVCYFLCNFLDCADGQLARLKKNGTRLGRIVDGFIDYVSSIAIYCGLGTALTSITGSALYGWGLAVTGGVSTALQAFYFDYYRNMYLKYVYNKVSSIDDEIMEFEEEQERIAKEGGNFIEKMLVDVYLVYCRMQKRTTPVVTIEYDSARYRANNQWLLRYWSWIGSTTHIVLLIIFAFLNRLDWYLILVATLGNVILASAYIMQKRALQKSRNQV